MFAYLAAGAVWVEVTLAGLEEHTLGHDGGTHRLVASQHRAGQQDQEHQEAGGHHQTMRLHVSGQLRRCEHCGGAGCQLMGCPVGTEQWAVTSQLIINQQQHLTVAFILLTIRLTRITLITNTFVTTVSIYILSSSNCHTVLHYKS